jgi:hypothetical protein
MATVNKWSGVAVAMQSALGANKTITAVALGATATITATHDFAAGDYIVFNVQGTTQLNDKVFRVDSVSTTVSFVIEDTDGTSVDTTGWGAFTSGTCNKITFGTSISTMVDFNASGGEANPIPTTTIHDDEETEIPGTKSPLVLSFSNIWDPSEAGLIALGAADQAAVKYAFKITFKTGVVAVFTGYVSYSGAPTGTAQDKVVSPGSIRVAKRPTYYAS